MRRLLMIWASAALLAGCAVSANEFAPSPLPQFAPPTATINERYVVNVADPSVLSLKAVVLGSTCSAVDVSGEFQQRFTQILDQALSGVFVGGGGAGATTISIRLTPETPRVRLLRRGYMSGDARVEFALAADVSVTRANGERKELQIAASDTRVQADNETMTCDGAGRALAHVFDESAVKLAERLRQAVSED